jgi:hypothetical protein
MTRVGTHAAAALDGVGIDGVKDGLVLRRALGRYRRAGRLGRLIAASNHDQDQPRDAHSTVQDKVEKYRIAHIASGYTQLDLPDTRHKQIHIG